jgi:hypothetical protein
MAVDLPNLLEGVMEHKTRDEIRDAVDILPTALQTFALEELRRSSWVEALEREGGGASGRWRNGPPAVHRAGCSAR